tara:strand:+ start:902 stop:1084 length:183 start_codon:yes stop_codon:yes gene_type:complete
MEEFTHYFRNIQNIYYFHIIPSFLHASLYYILAKQEFIHILQNIALQKNRYKFKNPTGVG